MRKLKLFLDAKAANTPPRGISKASRVIFSVLTLLFLSIGQVWGALPTSPKWVATDFADIANNATVIIICNSDDISNVALPSTATTSNPARKVCTLSTTAGVTTITPPSGTSLADLAWTVEKKTSTWKFFQEGSSTIRLYLTGTSSNTALRVGNATSTNDEFVLGNGKKLLKVSTAGRYVGFYEGSTNQDWRTYSSETASNYSNGALTFYVLQTSSCTNPVTITKGAETNGTYTLSATSVCGDGAGEDVTISNISPATGYEFDEITTSASGTVHNTLKKVTGIQESTTITVKFKEKQKYTVSFNVGGSTASQADITEASAGAGITLPTGPTPTCTGWTFAGWAAAAVASETTTAPTLLSGTYHPTENVMLYAVYSRSEGTPETWNKVTSAPSNWSGDYVIVNEDATYAMTPDFYSGTSGEFLGESVTITDNKVVSPSNKMIWVVERKGATGDDASKYSFKNKSTETYANISGDGTTKAALSESAVWFTINSNSTAGVWDVVSATYTGRGFAFYPSRNSFRTYAPSSNNTGYLYKKSGGMTYYYLSNPTCTPPAVADPVISLAEGEYEGTQSVTITCETTGAKIYYTTNGSDPTASSTLYNGAISVSASQTIKAIAIKDEVESSIVSAEYTIITTCETPTFSLAAGSYEGTQSVEISCTRAGVTIYYTTDGSDPAESATRIEYTGAISVSESKTIKAVATKANLTNSAIASATYTITAGPDVTLDFLDGKWSFPTSYQTTEEEFTNSVTSYAVTCKGTGSNGYKITSDYLMLGKQYAYIILPEFSNPVEKIVFVKGNGDNPSGNVVFNIFDGDDAVSTAVTGCNANKEFIIVNPAANKQYTLKVTSDHNLQIGGLKIYFGEAPAVAQPTISGNAAFVGSQDVTISCATTGAAIYYTTDATKKDDPSTTEWSTYGTKVTLNASCTLYAAATTDGGTTWSTVASKAFTATPLYTSIEALQGVATTTETTVFVQMTNWLVTAVSGSNAYVTDGSGKGMILYKYGHGFAANDKLNKDQLETKLQFYSDGGCAELKNLTTANFAGEGELVHNTEITPIDKTASQFAALTVANQGALFKVNNLTYDATNGKFMNGTDEVAYYNKFSIDESGLADGHIYNVTGVAVYHKSGNVVQLCPRTAADLQDATSFVEISFDANTTGSYGGTLPTTVNHISGTDYTIPAASLTREDGYYQLGWNTTPSATTALTSLENVTTNQTLYAIWKETANCTISFFSKGQLYDTKVKAQNAEYDFNDVVAPSVQGWTFYGWSADEIATEEASATKLTSVTPTSETMSLYAIYSRKVDGTPYTQYEKVTSAPSNWSGEYLLVYENSATQGYVWDGTDNASNYKTATIASSAIAEVPTGAVTITAAAVTDGYTLQINGGDNNGKYLQDNGNNSGLKFNTIENAAKVVITSETGWTKLMFSQRSIRYNDRFRYYSSTSQQDVQLYRKNTVVPQSDVYTTAPVVRYNITFVLASGEEGTFNPISVEEGENAILPTEVPTKTHNSFLKWSDGVNEYAAGATITNVSADKELHATWNPETPASVTFNLNGASGSIAAITDLYGGDPYQLPAAPAYDDDHAFAGWSDGVNVYAAEAAMTMTSPAADVEYVAQWNDVVVDQVVILAKYAGNWYAVKAEAGEANHTILGVQVDYRYGNIYNDFTAEQKAAITWTRKTVGNQMSFKNGDNYLTGKTSDSNDLDLATDECFWTCDASTDPAKYYTNSIHTILYSGSAGVFKNYKSSNATSGETGAYSALPIVVSAKFNTTYTRTVSGNYGTICLPKAGVMTNGVLYEISYYDADQKKIFFDEVEGGVMVAGAPYIFKPNENVTELKVAYTDVAVVNNAGHKNGLYGHYDLNNPIEGAEAARLFLAIDDYFLLNNEYWKVDQENRVYVDNYRAYIKLDKIGNDVPPQAYGRRRVSLNVNGEQVATGFENLNASEKPVKLIIDGNIYILRGEKLYDTTGRLVK